MNERATPSVGVRSAARGMLKIACGRLALYPRPSIVWVQANGKWNGLVRSSEPSAIRLVVGRDPRPTARTVAHEVKHVADLVRGRIARVGPDGPDPEAERRAEAFAQWALREWDRRYTPDGRRRWIETPGGGGQNWP